MQQQKHWPDSPKQALKQQQQYFMHVQKHQSWQQQQQQQKLMPVQQQKQWPDSPEPASTTAKTTTKFDARATTETVARFTKASINNSKNNNKI